MPRTGWKAALTLLAALTLSPSARAQDADYEEIPSDPQQGPAVETAVQSKDEEAKKAKLPADETAPAGEIGADETATSSAAGPLFVKGDLIHIGTRELVSRFDHFGVRVGPHIIDKDFYLGVTPGGALYTGPWAFAVQVPLNLLMLQGGSLDFGGAKIRREDWDEVSDFARLIRFITYGRKESSLYFTINSLRPTTLGNGQLMHHYQANIDIDRSMTGVIFEAYNDYAGFQLSANDITFKNRVLGGLLFVKPFGFMDDEHWLLRSISLGLEYAGDLRAPRCILTGEETDAACVKGSGNQAGFDPLTGLSRDHTFARTDAEFGRPVVEEVAVHAIGFSGQVKLLKLDRSDLKLYGTFHQFLLGGEAEGGNGFAVGLLGRFTAGESVTHAFRTITEFRTFGSKFQPGYFDTLYEIAKFQYPRSKEPFQVPPTKYQAIFGDPANGFNLTDDDRRFGFNVEASWAIFGGDRNAKRFAIGVGLAASTAGDDTNFYAHLELPVLKYVQIFGTFMRLNAKDIGAIFDTSTSEDIVVLSGARVQILPILFINAHYSRAFEIVRGNGREFHLGNQNVVDETGRPSPYFTSDRIYENVQTLFAEIELGWEFKD